ncbi:hypothetical protein LINJ_23_0590 [Leishmania infantum JPCM5]|uniref:EF-hand_domain_containing_protein_-_putative n=2 Tax=Leishmania infantum TaxID=5671 RepID=A0A6L0XDY8_LEIIN|nr:hypothetical protein LINJ_23_0590 [Leishmania infantum JPCM5]CAC9489290.1 EF-hand_domain_containing_protein_-_putative [Leishmania infantum]CAM68161.1 hypothetical protein LINJ_23_0590 [Leishmania infantum JPCM5]SUZ41932.1 EF-hand_domain_containing_protein_-_putative [Leishmania infantum]|eukprot:XP_001465735.1 hypothetical protein LINJ_23_0590 [Leishmania infantum JPCM5]
MSRTAETVEELARRYYLTTALVEEAGRLFDTYAGSGDAPPANSNEEPFITVPGLQRLMVKMGTPISQHGVVELLRFFGSAAAVAVKEVELSDGPANGQQSPAVKGARSPVAATAPASQQPSSRQRKKKSGATAQKTGAKDAFESSTKLGADHSAGCGASSGTESANSSPLAAPLHVAAPPSAVTAEGMNFSAFVYFLLVYPELSQRPSGMAATASTTNAATRSGLHVSIPELFATIDADADGVWSVHDLRHAAEVCVREDDGLLQEDPDLCHLAEMHPAELAVALHELDVDGDGVVTLDDVRQALYY